MAASDPKRNAYAVLGLHKGASNEEIKQAYVSLVKKYNPEVHTDRFMIIQGAFDRLRDPEKRAHEDILTFNFIASDFTFSKEERVEAPDAKLNQAIQMLEQQNAGEDAQKAQKLIQGYLMRSFKNVQKKLLKEAIEDWRRVLEIDPTHSRAKHNLMHAYMKLGYAYANHKLYDEAVELWEKAAQMDPDNDKVIHNLAIACEHAGDRERAQKYWDATVKRWQAEFDRNPDDEYLRNCIIEAHRHLSEWQEEKEEQPAATAAGETNSTGAPSSATARPGSQAAPKKSGDELERCREILKLKPDDFDANFRIAHLLMERKEWGEAIKHLSELRRKFPKNIEIMHSLGWAHMNNQEVDQAFRAWRQGLKLDPKNFSIREALIKGHMMMGRALREKNLFINSLVHFKELAKYTPDSDEVHYELGRTYQMKGDLRSAYNEYQKVIKINPRHKHARGALSELKMRRA